MNQCLDNIKKMEPPVPCSREFCQSIFTRLDRYCGQHAYPPFTPIPMDTPSGLCWCCCDALPDRSAVATPDGAFKPLNQLRAGDQVAASGLQLAHWDSAAVLAVGHLQAGCGDGLACTLQIALPDDSLVTLTIPGDTLLLNGGGRLQPANRMRAGQVLTAVDGRPAQVLASQASSAAVSLPYLGPLDAADPLAGHLLNLSGLVCADLAVGIAALLGQLPPALQDALDAYLTPIPPFTAH